MKLKILNPNCSEVVWRLNEGTGEKIWTDTSASLNDCLDNAIGELEAAKKNGEDIKKLEIDFFDNEGGGGNGSHVKRVFEIAKQYVQGKITKEEAKEIENAIWYGEENFFFCGDNTQ